MLATGGLPDQEGEVEFRALHERRGRPGTLHELRPGLARDEGRWVYVGAVEADLG